MQHKEKASWWQLNKPCLGDKVGKVDQEKLFGVLNSKESSL